MAIVYFYSKSSSNVKSSLQTPCREITLNKEPLINDVTAKDENGINDFATTAKSLITKYLDDEGSLK